MTIGIYSRHFKPNQLVLVERLIKALIERKNRVLIHRPYLEALASKTTLPKEVEAFENTLDTHIDLIISIGGDGTILDTVQIVGESGIPVAGINTGRLGFLADIKENQVLELVNSIENNTYSIDERTLIHVETNQPLFGEINYGLNEFSLHKTDSSSMITIHVFLNGEFLNSYWADGLIVATPTGSTAYSLSCGGPIIFPGSNNFVITPVSPHNLNARPMIIPDNTVVSFEVESRANNFLCAIDSRYKTADLSYQLAIKKERFKFKLLRMPENHYLKTLREKLRWGEDSRN